MVVGGFARTICCNAKGKLLITELEIFSIDRTLVWTLPALKMLIRRDMWSRRGHITKTILTCQQSIVCEDSDDGAISAQENLVFKVLNTQIYVNLCHAMLIHSP